MACLFILSGPSGSGKGTLRQGLFERAGGLAFSVSCTTRGPRKGERDGVDYRFVSPEQFERYRREGAFLEYAHVHENEYGTLREDVMRQLAEGRDVVLEVDVKGAMRVMREIPDAVGIFIAPPSMETLAERLEKRASETPEQLALRIRNAREEMQYAPCYDHVVVNDDAERALDELVEIVDSYRKGARKG